MTLIPRVAILVISLALLAEAKDPIEEYSAALKSEGQSPRVFVQGLFDQYDLIIFDDALHNAYEPWVFYQELLRDPAVRKRIQYVFVEVLPTVSQPDIDSFLAQPTKDFTILARAFQDDYSGYGWRYESCLDLLGTVWEVNRTLPEGERISVVGVNQPVYWEGIHTTKDYDLFNNSLSARDYYMYLAICDRLEGFRGGKKGIFLTNTRHAYNCLKDASGKPIWNCATFFHEWNPEKTFSIRVHNLILHVTARKATGGQRTAEGLEEADFAFVRLDGGLWDRAFERNGNGPVALPLIGNVFGRAPYIGNQMLQAAPGQTMADVNDAVIFLAPLEELHRSAETAFFYTPEFKQELKRRLLIVNGGNVDGLLKDYGATSLDEFIEKLAAPVPVRKSPVPER